MHLGGEVTLVSCLFKFYAVGKLLSTYRLNENG